VDTQKSESPVDSFPSFPAFNDTTQLALEDSVENGQIEDTTDIIEPGEEITAIDEPIGFRDSGEEKIEDIEDENIPGGEEPSGEVEPEQEVEELELRKLPQIKHDLMSNRYQLAEYYLLKVENFDSASVHYKRFLSLHSDTLLTPKALFSLRFIYSQPGHQDSLTVDSLESLILNNYPESIFAEEILKQKGLLVEKKDDEQTMEKEAQRLFLQAESLYFADQLEEALQKYEQVSVLDTSSEWGAKAMYAKAWIYEKELNEKELALNTFERIIKAYPTEKEYLKAATEKTTMPKETVETPVDTTQSEETVTAKEDTILAVGDEVPESIQGDGHSVSSQTIERDKILWRMNRYRK
jgi:outer membrane protein assembly factor BamD (BamD/ComL family)